MLSFEWSQFSHKCFLMVNCVIGSIPRGQFSSVSLGQNFDQWLQALGHKLSISANAPHQKLTISFPSLFSNVDPFGIAYW